MSERTLHARNPRTGAIDYVFEAPGEGGVRARARALRAAQSGWAARPLSARIAVLHAFASALERHAGAITAALEVDTGRRRVAAMEIASVRGAIAGWCAQTPHLLAAPWRQGLSAPGIRHRTEWTPYALVGVISPWNFPLLLSFIDATPALLAGCAVIVKPSEVTPRWLLPFAAALREVPDLNAVLALTPGDGATGQDVLGEVDLVCFTGSLATGRKIAAGAAARMIPAYLELGGKDPLIITRTANLDHAVAAALRGSVLATGQACQSIERIYVAREVYAAFVDRLVAAAQAARLNWPDIAHGDIGPLIFARQADVIADHLADAFAKGARALTGGQIERHGGGFWVRPTVLVDVTHTMRVMSEETFGPILPVMAFDSEDEAVRLANDTEYGLSAAVIAGSLEEAETIARRIDAGAVSLNDAALTALFHEAEKESFKHSGLGRSRMGAAGFERFFRAKALIAQTAAPTPLAAFREDA